MSKIKEFFNGVRKETSRIHWPNAKTLVKYSTASIFLIVFFALFFFGLDALFAFLKGVVS